MYLAQVNIARMKDTMESETMADFAANLDGVNSLADNSEGFIWRLADEENNATSIKVFEDDFLIINMSVWKDAKSLFDFVYNSGHMEVLKRKKEWFHKMVEMHMALWFIKVDHLPTPVEAKERLEYLNKNGETPYSFTFRSKFTIADYRDFYLKSFKSI